MAPSPFVHLHVGARCTSQAPGGSNSGPQAADAWEGGDMKAAARAEDGQHRAQSLVSLLALTGFSSTDVVPLAHRTWLVELLDDVKLVTACAPQQVLAVTRAVLRYLLDAVRAQQLAQAQDAAHGGEWGQQEGDRRAEARRNICLLHPVKVTSLGVLKERAAFVRTDLAGSVRRALAHAPVARQPAPGHRTHPVHQHTPGHACAGQGASPHEDRSGRGVGGAQSTESAVPQAGTCPPPGSCFQFFTSGTCRFAATCRYKHAQDMPAQRPPRETHERKADKSASGAANVAPLRSLARGSGRIEVVIGELCSEPSQALHIADRCCAGAHAGASGHWHATHGAPEAAATDGGPSPAGTARAAGQAASGGKLAEGQGQEGEVGVLYLRDATGFLPIHFAHSLSALHLADTLVLCSSFNLVHSERKDQEGAGEGAGEGAAAPSRPQPSAVLHACGAENFKFRTRAAEQYLEVWEAEGIAASTRAHYRPPDSAQLPEGKPVRVAHGAGPTLRGEKEVDLEGVVLSVSPLMCTQKGQGSSVSRAYFFLVELAPVRDAKACGNASAQARSKAISLGRSSHAEGRQREGEHGAGGGDVGWAPKTTLVVFQGKALMKWYPFFRLEQALVVTSVRRAKLNEHTPCWRATLPLHHEHGGARGNGGSCVLAIPLPDSPCLSGASAGSSQASQSAASQAAGGAGSQGGAGSEGEDGEAQHCQTQAPALPTQRRVASRLSQAFVDSLSLPRLSLPSQHAQHAGWQQVAARAGSQEQQQRTSTRAGDKRMEQAGADEAAAAASAQGWAARDGPAVVDYEGVVTGVFPSLYGPVPPCLPPVPPCLPCRSRAPAGLVRCVHRVIAVHHSHRVLQCSLTPSPTLSPTDPVPLGQLWPTGPIYSLYTAYNTAYNTEGGRCVRAGWRHVAVDRPDARPHARTRRAHRRARAGAPCSARAGARPGSWPCAPIRVCLCTLHVLQWRLVWRAGGSPGVCGFQSGAHPGLLRARRGGGARHAAHCASRDVALAARVGAHVAP